VSVDIFGVIVIAWAVATTNLKYNPGAAFGSVRVIAPVALLLLNTH
jgi:hypothetical protein